MITSSSPALAEIAFTGRPSRVRGVFRVDVPRDDRDGATLDRLAAELAGQFPA